MLVAQYYGASDTKALRETVHTSVLASLIFGCIVLVIGITLAAPMLELMGTPEEVLDQACLYMRIYFIGMPASMLYNFGAAILRAVGDTQRPLYFLFIAGIVNVLLNLFCVIVLHMGVEGVAIPTVISQCVSAGLVLLCLVKGPCALSRRPARPALKEGQAAGHGEDWPARGHSGLFFLHLQRAHPVLHQLLWRLGHGGEHCCLQHRGLCLHRPGRLFPGSPELYRPERGRGPDKNGSTVFLPLCAALVLGVGLALGSGAYLLGNQLLSIYSSDPEVIAFGMKRMAICCVLQCVGGLMGVMVGTLRGHGLFLCAHGHHHRLCVRFPG